MNIKNGYETSSNKESGGVDEYSQRINNENLINKQKIIRSNTD
jgi:hypothetical protein